MKTLVIVESPTKARTISRYLGKEYEIRPSMGHVKDLPKSKLGVSIDNNFDADFDILEEKKALIAELQKLAKNAEMILLATDPDREGEAISSDIKELLEEKGKGNNSNSKKKKVQGKNDPRIKRIVFHEITESAIRDALNHPRDVDEHLVNAQTARRVLDRLVGYQLSPMLWRKVRRGLSAGRVQSVALRLIVEREREVEKFTKEPYFSIHSITKKGKEKTVFTLIEINSDKVEQQFGHELYDGTYTVTKTKITKQEQANAIVKDVSTQTFIVSDVHTREAKRSPYPPFTTSTLQQQAAQRYGFPGKRTMSLAQKLYEEGYITYHRTDSVSLSPVAMTQLRTYIEKEYGIKYLPEKPRLYFTKQKNAQEAHEAIRPTDVKRVSAVVKAELGDAYAKLYDLIWKRAVASQMNDAKIEMTTVYVDSAYRHPGEASTSIGSDRDSLALLQKKTSKYRFKANGSVLLFDGFLKLTPQALEDTRLPKFETGTSIIMEDVHWDPHETTPPPRYNDASLIKTLEEKSIGRPSTYASIIGTITDRGYVTREEKKFVPTAVGVAVNDFLVTNFSTIDDVPFTAQMEDHLDQIANGQKEWLEMMRDFYKPFAEQLKNVEGAERVKIEVEKTGEMCPACQEGNLVIRTGRFGKFFSCDRFPDCKFTKQYVEQTDVTCPKDSGKIIIKKTRKGRKFFGCSNYPICNFAVWKLEDIKGYKPPDAVKV